MIALLATGRTEIGTLAAVTFTRKAAAQLRGRFQVELERARLAAKDGAVRDRLDAALTGLERVFIGTISSFCARLLRERPIEAAIDPDFRELEDHEDRVMRESAWDEYLGLARLENEAALRGLDEAGLEPYELESAFATLAEFADVTPAPGREEPPDFGPARRALEDLIELGRVLVPRERPEKGRDALQQALVRSFRRRDNLGFEDPRRLAETIELFEKELGVTKIRWAPATDAATLAGIGRIVGRAAVEEAQRKCRAKGDLKALAYLVVEIMQAAAESFRETYAVPVLRAWREFRHTRALAFLCPAVEAYAKRRRDEGRLNFQDQLLLAAKLLREKPEVRNYFRKRFHPVLVDEFQDTDPIQTEILFFLTGSTGDVERDRTERDWTAFKPVPGALFLVGDPKQSIYRFRRADIDIYNLVKDRIVRAGGAVLELSTNFRSLGAIAAWINPLFDPDGDGLFPKTANAYQAGFIPLAPMRGPGTGPFSGVRRITVPVVQRHSKEPIADFDSRRLAAFVKWALDGNLTLEGGGRRIAAGRPRRFSRPLPQQAPHEHVRQASRGTWDRLRDRRQRCLRRQRRDRRGHEPPAGARRRRRPGGHGGRPARPLLRAERPGTPRAPGGRRTLLLRRSGLRRARLGAGAAGLRRPPGLAGDDGPDPALGGPRNDPAKVGPPQPPGDGGDGRQPGRQRPQAGRDPARARERGHDLVRRRRRVHGRVGRRPAGRGDEPDARTARRGPPDEPPQGQRARVAGRLAG